MSDLLSALATLSPAQLELLAEVLDDLDLEPDDGRPESLARPARQSELDALLAAVKKLRRQVTRSQEWDEELGYEVPAPEKEGHRVAAVPSVTEMQNLIASAQHNQRDELILRLFYATGLRRGEMAELKVGDVNFDAATLFIRSGKGDKDRYVLLDDKTLRLLNRYTAALGPEASIFELSARQLNRIVKRYGRKTGLLQRYEAIGRNFTSRGLRHAFATHCYESGADLFTLKTLLGHAYLGTTEYYIEMGVGRLRHNYNNHHPLCSKSFDEH